MRQLEIKRNEIGYTGSMAYPMLDFLQHLNAPAKALLEAFEPFGFGLESMQLLTASQAVSQQAILFNFGWQGTYTFKLDRVEATFWDLDESALQRSFEVLLAADRSLRKHAQGFQIKRHQLVYSAHGLVQPGHAGEILGSFVTPQPKAGGVSAGTGVIFHWDVPDKKWITQLTLDRSMAFKDGLFLLLSIESSADNMNLPMALVEGRQYLSSILRELGLELAGERASQ